MSTGSTPAERAAAAVDAMRRLWLDMARLAIGGLEDDPEHVELFQQWLHHLPMAGVPRVTLGATMALGDDRTRWFAGGDPGEMIPAVNVHLRTLGASGAELDDVARLGPAIDARRLGSWLQFRRGTASGGWAMSGDLDVAAALQTVDDHAQRATLLDAIGGRPATTLRSVARSVGEAPVTQLVIGVGPASDDDAVRAMTDLAADLEAPAVGDDVLGIILAEAGEQDLALSVWTLGDGLARIGVVVERPSSTLLVRLAMAGDWPEGTTRAAALLGTADLTEPDRLEWYLDTAGPGLEITAVLPEHLPEVAHLPVDD